jgi:hypothetical protein
MLMGIQNTERVTRDDDNVVLSVRLRGADAARFWRVMDTAKSRNAYCDRSDVIRELLGLDPPSLLTAEEIKHFRSADDKKQNNALPPNSNSPRIPEQPIKKRKTGT